MLHFLTASVKIMGEVGEISESVFRQIGLIYAAYAFYQISDKPTRKFQSWSKTEA